MFHIHQLSSETNYDYIEIPSSKSHPYRSLPSLDPHDPQHAIYITRKRDAKAENLTQIKAPICQAVHHINFKDPIQIRRTHEALIHKVNRDAICIGTKYSVKIEPMHFEWEEFIPTLEKHFPDILQKILACDHQRHNQEQGESYQQVEVKVTLTLDVIIQTDSILKDHPVQDFHDQEPEVGLNVMAALTTVHQECLINANIMVTTPTQLMTQPTDPGMYHTALQLSQWTDNITAMVMQTGEHYMQSACMIIKLTFLMIIDISKYITPIYPIIIK